MQDCESALLERGVPRAGLLIRRVIKKSAELRECYYRHDHMLDSPQKLTVERKIRSKAAYIMGRFGLAGIRAAPYYPAPDYGVYYTVWTHPQSHPLTLYVDGIEYPLA